MIFIWKQFFNPLTHRIDSIFNFLSKKLATNIDKDTLADSILQLITLKLLLSKESPNSYDSLYLSNVDQREIEPTLEGKSDKIDDDFVQKKNVKISKTIVNIECCQNHDTKHYNRISPI